MEYDGTRFSEISEMTGFPTLFQGVAGSLSARQSGLSASGSLTPDSSGGSCGTEAFTDIARFGEQKIELLRRFRPK
jgi:hypothetical protein